MTALCTACTSPGTEPTVDAVRCARTPETPPAAATPLAPVWRTYPVPSVVHRLVVSLSSTTMRAWLDGQPTSPVQTRVTDAGPVARA